LHLFYYKYKNSKLKDIYNKIKIMKVNIREFKHIVRNIIKEEMEKVDEDFGTSVDYKYAKGYGDESENPKEDIETPKETKSLLAKIKSLFSSLKEKGMTEKEIVQVLKKS